MDELALSQWGLWLDDLEPVERAWMAQAYVRRRQFEARAMMAAVSESFQGGGGGGASGRVAPDIMFAMMTGLL